MVYEALSTFFFGMIHPEFADFFTLTTLQVVHPLRIFSLPGCAHTAALAWRWPSAQRTVQGSVACGAWLG